MSDIRLTDTEWHLLYSLLHVLINKAPSPLRDAAIEDYSGSKELNAIYRKIGGGL